MADDGIDRSAIGSLLASVGDDVGFFGEMLETFFCGLDRGRSPRCAPRWQRRTPGELRPGGATA